MSFMYLASQILPIPWGSRGAKVGRLRSPKSSLPSAWKRETVVGQTQHVALGAACPADRVSMLAAGPRMETPKRSLAQVTSAALDAPPFAHVPACALAGCGP